MRKASFQPRDIKPETVCIGDLIKVSTKRGDVTDSRTGKVARREHDNGFSSSYSADGELLFTFHPSHKVPYRITLIHRRDSATALF